MEKNIYLDLMDDEGPKKVPVHHAKPTQPDMSAPRIAPDWATVNGNEPVPSQDNPVLLNPIEKEDSNHNTYLDLMDDEEHKFHSNSGTDLGNYLSLYGSNLAANAGTRAEQVWKLPAGSLAELRAAMNPTKAKITPAMAAQALVEARTPPVAQVPAMPVEKPLPGTSGAKWLENYANIQDPEFSGGVPEAAQKYQSTKPQGKVTGKNFKRFGNKPLNIAGQAVQTALSEDEALMRVRQALYEREMHKIAVQNANKAAAERVAQVEREAQTLGQASKSAKILSGFGKTAGVAGVGLGAYDAYKRMHEGDTYGAALGGLGTAASIAPMFMGSAGILPAVGAAAPLMMMAHDRIEHLKQHPEDVQLQNDRFDPLGMPIR